MCALSVHAGTERDIRLGRYFLPPRLTGAVYHDFSRNDLRGLLQDVDSQTRIYLLFGHDGDPTLYFSRRQILNNVLPDKWIGRGGPTAWLDRSPDLGPWHISTLSKFQLILIL